MDKSRSPGLETGPLCNLDFYFFAACSRHHATIRRLRLAAGQGRLTNNNGVDG